MNNTFVKIGESFINVNAIDGIFPDNDRYSGGWIIQLNGKDIHVNDIQPVLDAINIPSSKTAFDPDKRVIPSNPLATDTDNFDKQAMKVKLMVTEFNKGKLYPVEAKINKNDKTITIADGHKEMVITDGVITKDTLGDYDRLIKLKTDVIKLFV